MRQANNNNRRMRGRGPRKQHMGAAKGNGYDGGAEPRVRGNAHQVLEKYLQLARDAGTAGDRVAAENYLQHAEHYYRIINEMSGQRPRNQGRELSVADVNVQNISPGLSSALYSHGITDDAAQPEGEAAPAPGNEADFASAPDTDNVGNAGADGNRGAGRGYRQQRAAPRAAATEQPDYPDDLIPAYSTRSTVDGDRPIQAKQVQEKTPRASAGPEAADAGTAEQPRKEGFRHHRGRARQYGLRRSQQRFSGAPAEPSAPGAAEASGEPADGEE